MAKHEYIALSHAQMPLRATVVENPGGFQPVVLDDLDRWVKWSGSIEDLQRAWEIARKMRDNATRQRQEQEQAIATEPTGETYD